MYVPSRFKPEGMQAEFIKLRVQRMIEDPQNDKLSRALWNTLESVLPTLSGTFLDVGCYGGWIYHYVKDAVEYHGIDNWPVAIEAAKDLFGDHFSVEELRETTRRADTVWATQLHPENKIDEILPFLAKMANKQVIFTAQTREHNGSSIFKEVKELPYEKYPSFCGIVHDSNS